MKTIAVILGFLALANTLPVKRSEADPLEVRQKQISSSRVSMLTSWKGADINWTGGKRGEADPLEGADINWTGGKRGEADPLEGADINWTGIRRREK